MADGLVTVAKQSAALAAGAISSRELTRERLDAIAAANASLNAFITIDETGAMAQAEAADMQRSRGEAGPLTGVPIAHKDVLMTAGLRTTCGSRPCSLACSSSASASCAIGYVA